MTKRRIKDRILIGDRMEKIKRKKIHINNLLIIFFIVCICILVKYIFKYRRNINCVGTEGTIENVKISNSKEIDIEDIIKENQKEEILEEIIKKEEKIEYITEYLENNEMPDGSIQVLQEGRTGEKEIIESERYIDGKLIEKNEIKNYLRKSPINKVVEVGTNKKYILESIRVGEKVETTANQNNIMSSQSENSEKLTTLRQGEQVNIIEIEKEWYKISFEGIEGYIKKENVKKNIKKENENYKGGKIEKLDFNMPLNKPSGFTKEEFEKVLKDSKDVNSIFSNNAKYFYYAEKQYNINGVFLAAVAIHESNWGKSSIALQKHNLFGYGAYDSNPYNYAYEFKEYSESIDLLARVFVKYYLNPKGTNIYNGEKAEGTYYNGNNLQGVNKKYASDKNWANAVYKHMKYLYDKL